MRDIRFRVFDRDTKKMYYRAGLCLGDNTITAVNGDVMQYVGHSDMANKDIFELDILRETLEMAEGDVNNYFIVTWVQEWAMFAALLHDEYYKYLKEGADSLDESMFWTFTIEKGNQFSVCGNILEHPDYIRKALELEGQIEGDEA